MRVGRPRLGIDFGRVIGGGLVPGVEDTDFLDGSLDAAVRMPSVPGMWDVVPRLVALFDGQVWVVSKCGEWVERRTLQWLAHNDFAQRTGIALDRVRFCRQRADKAVHAKELALTHFVDDRLEVLGHMRVVVPHLYAFGPQTEPVPQWAVHVPTWSAVWNAVVPTLASKARDGERSDR